MIYRAYSSDMERLRSLPETGMGYQVIEARKTGSHESHFYIAYNSQLIVDFSSAGQYKQKMRTESFSSILYNADYLNIQTGSITAVSKSRILETRSLSASLITYNKRHTGSRAAKDSPKQYASGTDKYVRLSAYEDDFRIDTVNMRLKPGSYATTYVDYRDCVNTNDDPVDRYALPNDEVIKWAFYVQPKHIDQLQLGIAQPAFGHSGGGIEAFFEDGTSNNTYLYRTNYGS